MTIAHELDALRASFSDCSVVAFGDVRTRLIFCSSQEEDLRREYLDELCEQAANCFELLDAISSVSCNLKNGSKTSNDAVVMGQRGATVFLRSDQDVSDFLCMVCGSPKNTNAMIKTARTTLNNIADDQ